MSYHNTLIMKQEDGSETSEDFTWDNNGDIIRKIGPDKKFITMKNDSWEYVKISLLDLANIWDYSDDEISEMLREILWVTIQSPQWIRLVNSLAQNALKYLREELFYSEQELKWIWNIHFQNSKEVINFLKWTWKAQWLKKCMLAKVWLLFQEGVGEHVEKIREKSIGVLENKVIPNLEDIAKKSSLWIKTDGVKEEFAQTWKSVFTGSIFAEMSWWVGKRIDFQVEIREKTIESTISKALREKDYINQGDIMDLLWIRITTKNKEDKLIILNLVSQLAFKHWEYRIKNKGWITKADLETLQRESEYFRNNASMWVFLERLEESFKSVEKRVNSALKYSDIKLVPIWEGKKLSFEILFLDEDHTNNTGLAHHIPFTYIRKIAERIRLEWFITKESIVRIASYLTKKISESNKNSLWWISSVDLMKEMLRDIHDEILIKNPKIQTKSYEEIKTMKKQELEYELKRILPEYYAEKLIIFRDWAWNQSKKSKYTNKVWLENLSVLQGN